MADKWAMERFKILLLSVAESLTPSTSTFAPRATPARHVRELKTPPP